MSNTLGNILLNQAGAKPSVGVPSSAADSTAEGSTDFLNLLNAQSTGEVPSLEQLLQSVVGSKAKVSSEDVEALTIYLQKNPDVSADEIVSVVRDNPEVLSELSNEFGTKKAKVFNPELMENLVSPKNKNSLIDPSSIEPKTPIASNSRKGFFPHSSENKEIIANKLPEQVIASQGHKNSPIPNNLSVKIENATKGLQNLKGNLENSNKMNLQGGEDFLKGIQSATTNPAQLNALKMQAKSKVSGKMSEYGDKQDAFSKSFIKPVKSNASSNITSDITNLNSDLQSVQADNVIPFSEFQLKSEAQMLTAKPTQTAELNLSSVNVENADELISKISDYVTQNRLSNQESLDLTVRHDDLGKFKINVNQVRGQENINLEIMTMSEEGNKFFVQNEKDLAMSLTKSGIKLGDLKLVSGSNESSQAGFDNKNESSSEKGFSQNKQNSNFKGNEGFDHGFQRRKEMWNMYREQMGA